MGRQNSFECAPSTANSATSSTTSSCTSTRRLATATRSTPTAISRWSVVEQDRPTVRSLCWAKLFLRLGLRLLVYINASDYLPTTEATGVRIAIHAQEEWPFPDTFGYSAPTGSLSSFGMSMVGFEGFSTTLAFSEKSTASVCQATVIASRPLSHCMRTTSTRDTSTSRRYAPSVGLRCARDFRAASKAATRTR